MCGIVGIWDSSAIIDSSVFDSMVDSLSHRGPDGRGVKKLDSGKLLLGHRRLSIIDLSDNGNQPMPNEDNSLWLTFNGEIYNYKQLRKDLEGFGHKFISKSDSETVVHAYEEWGVNCVFHLRGIFAFAIFDTKNKKLFLARDHIGVKPLFFYHGTERFIFASQPRAILAADGFKKNIDVQAFSLYLAYGNTPSNSCIYEGIKKLLPGHWILYESGNITIQKYWSLNYKPIITDRIEAERMINEKIREAIHLQSVSDVKIGTLLSGGVDSTIITSILAQHDNNLSTFTVGFEEEESDERDYATFAAKSLRTNHHERVLSYEGACQLLPDIIEAFDEPFYLNAVFPYFAVARLVQSENVKVVLGGDGADELFAGYLWYDQFCETLKNHRSVPCWASRILGMKKNNRFSESIEMFFRYNGFFNNSEQNEIVNALHLKPDTINIYRILTQHWAPDVPTVLSAQHLDFNVFLVDHCLTKVDRASMACGLEVRVPFLDIELVELVFSIDHDIIYRNGERKSLLKAAMKDFLPKGMNANRKKGFSSPIGIWLSNGLSILGRKLLLDGILCAYGLIDPNKIYLNYDNIRADQQLLLISAELWCRRWIDNDIEAIFTFTSKLAKKTPRGDLQ